MLTLSFSFAILQTAEFGIAAAPVFMDSFMLEPLRALVRVTFDLPLEGLEVRIRRFPGRLVKSVDNEGNGGKDPAAHEQDADIDHRTARLDLRGRNKTEGSGDQSAQQADDPDKPHAKIAPGILNGRGMLGWV